MWKKEDGVSQLTRKGRTKGLKRNAVRGEGSKIKERYEKEQGQKKEQGEFLQGERHTRKQNRGLRKAQVQQAWILLFLPLRHIVWQNLKRMRIHKQNVKSSG
jgi:hypothetical protein